MSAVRLRLQRWGVANNPHYRIVAAQRRAKRDGKYLELLGNYDPIPNPKTGLKELQIKKDRAMYWISVGAEPSSRVAWLMAKAGLLPEPPLPTAKTISALPKKKAQQRAKEEEEKKKKQQQAAEEAASKKRKDDEAAAAAAVASAAAEAKKKEDEGKEVKAA